MTFSVLLIITIILCLTTIYTAEQGVRADSTEVLKFNITQFNISEPFMHQLKCDASPLYVLFEEYYQGHPLRDINLKRRSSHWNMTRFQIETTSMKNYSLGKQIGRGTFGTVFETTFLPTGETCAFKQLTDLNDVSMKKEIQIMQDLADAPNVLPVRDIVKEEQEDGTVKAGLVVQYFQAEDYKTMRTQISKKQLKSFIYQTLETLSFAHSKGIVHRDIKPLNVLMNSKTNEAKVIDWGMSEYYRPDKSYTTTISTLYFKSPELLLEFKNHDFALDIWATGCMLGEMTFLKNYLFRAKKYVPVTSQDADYETYKREKLERHRQHLDAIAQILGTLKLKQYADKFRDQMDLSQLDDLPEYKKVSFSSFVNENNTHLYDPLVDDLLDKMLTYDHTKRITAAEALMHPYFDEVREVTVTETAVPAEPSNLSFAEQVERAYRTRLQQVSM